MKKVLDLIELKKPDSSWAVGARNIKRELKFNFPGRKFSVTSESYSMGNCIDVYCGSDILKEVIKIIAKYQYGFYNSITDCYEIKRTNFHELFGSAKYVYAQRHYK